jgi:hypothetical protein
MVTGTATEVQRNSGHPPPLAALSVTVLTAKGKL